MTVAPQAPPSYGPPPDWGGPRRRRGSLVGPLILILIGGILLLQNLGYLSPRVWLELWRLWPLVLVLIGVELMFGYRIRGGMLALTVIGLVAIGLLAVSASDRSASGTFVSRTFAQTSQGASQANVTVRFGAGDLSVGQLEDRSRDQLASMTYDGPSSLDPTAHYSVVGGVGRLDYQVNSRGGFFGTPFDTRSGAPRMTIGLAPDVPLTLNLQTGAANTDLDLTGLRVTNLDLSTGATSTQIHLPRAAGLTVVRASSGAATLTFDVPPGVAAQIRHQGGLSTLNVDQTRFARVDSGQGQPGVAGNSMYRSPDYDSAANRVDITLETGVSTVNVR